MSNIINTYYGIFQINKDNGDVIKDGDVIGNVEESLLSEEAYTLKCNCKSMMLVLITKGLEIYHICPTCGRLSIISMRGGTKITFPDIEDAHRFQTIKRLHNTSLNEYLHTCIKYPQGKTNFRKAYDELIDFRQIVELGHASYIFDKFKLIVGIEYDPIDKETGKITYLNTIKNNDEFIADPYLSQLSRKIMNKYLLGIMGKINDTMENFFNKGEDINERDVY